jgi:ribonuclease VapC
VTVVLDASAVLALVFGEPGAEAVADRLSEATISSVNAAEVVSKLIDRKTPAADLDRVWTLVSTLVNDFTAPQALRSGQLRDTTRPHGLSLGDRACLALAEETGATILTADRAWADLGLGIDIELIR